MPPVETLGALALLTILWGCSGSSSDDPVDMPPTGEPPAEQPPSGEPSTATLSVDDVRADEGEGPVTFVVRAEGENLDGVTVDYVTADGSAQAGADFVSVSGSLSFVGSGTEQTVEVDLIADDDPEDEETFSLELSNPGGAEIASSGVATIIDNDSGPGICGAPDREDAQDNEAVLWKNCTADIWRLRVTSAADSLLYQGAISSSNGLSGVEGVEVEEGDEVATPDANNVTFALNVAGDRDEVRFSTMRDTGTCFELAQGGSATVILGHVRRSIESPFDLGTQEPCEIGAPPTDSSDLNVVVVLTDDQRFDTLAHMPNLSSMLLPHGVEFTNAYVPTPLCCPSRASTWSGGFLAHNTGVLTNQAPNGGMALFEDSDNLGARLQGAGYRTLFIGKWLNDYPRYSPYVPPGWDEFYGRASYETTTDWYSFVYGSGSSEGSSTTGTEVTTGGQYHVYYERDRILDFLQASDGEAPFLVVWATTPPHPPMTADEADRQTFGDFTYRGRGYGEIDLSDKPAWVRNPPQTGDDEEVRNQLRSMLSVDRSLASIIDAIAAQGELDETVFFFTSDNGYMWGEHGLWGKNKPYEESLRVPLLVVMPGIEPRTDDHLVYGTIDIPPTIYDLVGIEMESDGRSLLPVLRDPAAEWRNELYFEKLDEGTYAHAMWTSLRQDDWKYVEYFDGETELYDLQADPFELENVAGDPDHAELIGTLAGRLEELRAEGVLAIKPLFRIDTDGSVGETYELALEVWGDASAVQWTLESGELPPGLGLDPGTGLISGVPTTAGSWTFQVRATSSRLGSQAQAPLTFVTEQIDIEVL